MSNITKKHHYVPQFILKNFSKDKKRINIWNVNEKKQFKMQVEVAFQKKYLYKDDNNKEDTMHIENAFSKLESDVAPIIKKIIDSKNKIELNRLELKLIKKFLHLMEFRSKNRNRQYKNSLFDPLTELSLKSKCKDEDYVALWLRELKYLIENEIDFGINEETPLTLPIFQEVIKHYKGTFVVVFDACQGEEFFLTDNYGTFEKSSVTGLPIISFYPLSPRKLIALVSGWNLNSNTLYLDEKTSIPSTYISPPKNKYKNYMGNRAYRRLGRESDNDKFIYTISKIDNNTVRQINAFLINQVHEQLCFMNSNNIKNSLKFYNDADYRKKHSYKELLESI